MKKVDKNQIKNYTVAQEHSRIMRDKLEDIVFYIQRITSPWYYYLFIDWVYAQKFSNNSR